MLDRVSLDKAAVDAGFDIKEASAAGWLPYASTSCPLRVWLAMLDGQPIAALSLENVLTELALPSPAADLPEGAAGAFAASSFGKLQALLARGYALGNALPQQLLYTWSEMLHTLPATERDAFVKQRIGQDLFRQGLLALWEGRCALTGLAVPELLRASHAKPWKVATDAERLDVYNGLLLAAHLDAAFDEGLIAFGTTGALLVSSRLSSSNRHLLGLDRPWPAVALRPQHLPYMEFHRAHVFVR